jgi:3D (Asp-Asp-Asp) domain-containing protein
VRRRNMKKAKFIAISITILATALTTNLFVDEAKKTARLQEQLAEAKKQSIQLRSNIDLLKTSVQALKTSYDRIDEITTIEAGDITFPKDFKTDDFIISAYTPYDDVSGLNHDGDPNTTATGTVPGPGTFAVDPKVIPYGSTVIIMYTDGTIERGVAEDTGGAIDGNRIDVFRYKYSTAMKHGMKPAAVIWYEEEQV